MFPNLISEARLGAGSGFGNLTRSGKLQRLLSLSEAQGPGGPAPPPGTKQSCVNIREEIREFGF